MGSLAQIGGGIGQGMVANVQDKRRADEADANRAHQETLQRMRDMAAMSRTEKVGEINMSAYERQREDAKTDLTEKREYEQSLIPGVTAREDEVREDEQEHAIDVEAMKLYQKQTESGMVQTKDGKWEMKVLTTGEIGPNGIPVETDTFVVREPGTPFSYVQHGMNMLPHNYTPEQTKSALSIAENADDIQKSDVKELMKSASTDNDLSSEFMRVYGYLPAEYFRKIRNSAQGPEGFMQFRRTFQQPNIGGPRGGSESSRIRERMNAPEDQSSPFSAGSEAVMSSMSDEEYTKNFKAAGGTDEQLAEAQRLGLLPSQRRAKTQPDVSGGVLSEAMNARDDQQLPMSQATGMSDQEIGSITDWIRQQMQQEAYGATTPEQLVNR